MGRADLHVHTDAGDGLDSVTAIFEHLERRRTLDVVAITEHDDLAVALRARETWARRAYSFEVVTGMEVTTLDGHVIALFLERPVASLRRVEETLEAVHAQGGLCVVPHPFSWLTRSIGPATMDRLTAKGGPLFDALELATSSPASRPFLAKARRLNELRYRLPAVGASDAHFALAVGSAFTEFPGRTAAELRQAFHAGHVRGVAAKYPLLWEAGLMRTLALPLAGLSVTPRKLGWGPTVRSFVSRYAR